MTALFQLPSEILQLLRTTSEISVGKYQTPFYTNIFRIKFQYIGKIQRATFIVYTK